MNLLNSLYKISNESEMNGTDSCIICFNSNHIIYNGHFPGHPVTPGVIQMQIVEELVERKLQSKYNLISIKQCKFLKIINPETTKLVQVNYKTESHGNKVNVIANFELDDSFYFKFSGTFEKE